MQDERFWEQFDEIARQHDSTEIKVAQDAPIPYVYERGTVLVPDVHAARVLNRLDQVQGRPPGLGRRLERSRIPGVSRLPVPDDPPHQRDDRRPGPVQRAVDWLNEVCREREPAGFPHVAAPNHLFSITPVNLCPADEPVPATRPAWPVPATPASAGDGVTVLVIDTGLADEFHTELADGGPNVLRERRGEFAGTIRQYAGHGSFVAGVLGSIAPKVRIQVSNALVSGGAMLEQDFVPAVLAELDSFERATGDWPDIISLSAGATSHCGQQPVGLPALLSALDAHPRTVLVAAAGNDGTENEAFWPAAAAPGNRGVISVGALRDDQSGLACFSNYGDTVTVYAVGERMVNNFLTGTYHYRHEPWSRCRYHPEPDPLYSPGCTCVTGPAEGSAIFTGTARWSGTSFATPLVAGKIAAHLTQHPTAGDARTAAWDLIERSSCQVAGLRALLVETVR